MGKTFYECKMQIREGSSHLTSVRGEATKCQVKFRVSKANPRRSKSCYRFEMRSYQVSSQITNIKGEATKRPVKFRMAEAKLRRVRSNCEHQVLTCKESGRVLGTSHVNRQGHTEQTRRGKIMIADRRQDGRQPLGNPASERKRDFTKRKMMLTVGFRRVYIQQAPTYHLNPNGTGPHRKQEAGAGKVKQKSTRWKFHLHWPI